MENFDRSQIAFAYQSVFENSAPGIVVLDHLYQVFDDHNGFDADPYKNAMKSGQREVIRFIQRQLGIAQSLNKTPQSEEQE